MNDYNLTQFVSIMKGNGIIQPSILMKSHILYIAFEANASTFNQFIEQIKESYTYKKLVGNQVSQSAYLTTVLFNEIKSIEEALIAN